LIIVIDLHALINKAGEALWAGVNNLSLALWMQAERFDRQWIRCGYLIILVIHRVIE